MGTPSARMAFGVILKPEKVNTSSLFQKWTLYLGCKTKQNNNRMRKSLGASLDQRNADGPI